MSVLNNYTQVIKIGDWLRHNRGKASPKGGALKALEEMIELCYQAGATTEDITKVFWTESHKAYTRKEDLGIVHKTAMKEEVGDVIVCLTALCWEHDIDGITAVDACLERIDKREWSPNAEGVLRRPRP